MVGPKILKISEGISIGNITFREARKSLEIERARGKGRMKNPDMPEEIIQGKANENARCVIGGIKRSII